MPSHCRSWAPHGVKPPDLSWQLGSFQKEAAKVPKALVLLKELLPAFWNKC